MNFAGIVFVFVGIPLVACLFISAARRKSKTPTRVDKYYARKAQEVLDSGKLDPYMKKPPTPRPVTNAPVAEEPEWKKRIQLVKLLLETKIACEYCGEIVPPAARCSNCGAPSPRAK